jgi:AcrR family transcriptional regulator
VSTNKISNRADRVDIRKTMSPPVPLVPPAASVATPRTTYRHGDLRRALLDAGIALARSGGPAAVVLREATRRAGVVPNAAYRHFASREDLLQAVRFEALSQVANAMEDELATLGISTSAVAYAKASLRAVGTGYMRYALTETGLFRTAFQVPSNVQQAFDPAMAGRSGLNPYELLGAALDRMLAAGTLAPERRPDAEFLAWSAVHGLAMLIIEGPLHALTREQADATGQRVLDMVELGLQTQTPRRR